MDRSAAREAPSVRVPGYTVGKRIGVGGFGEVFQAKHDLIGRDVAIKVLHAKYSADPAAVARFFAEARAVNQISHPGIVEVFDFGELEDGREYFVMELLRGKSLRDLLAERTRLPLDEALPILHRIAAAIDAAHEAGIAHRDLKPDNVFVLDDGRVKLIDFGLAKLTKEAAAPVTETGAVFGTPLYMSPEQCRGRNIDARTDSYSFGVVAYHVLVGEPPFTGEALELALQHLNDQPVAPTKRNTELPARADRVLLALLAKDPADRPESLVAAVDALAGVGIVLRGRRVKRYAIAAAAILLGAAIAIAILLTRGVTPDEGLACVPGIERLAGVWDPTIRITEQARFQAVDRIEAPTVWRSLAAGFDQYSGRWAKQWDDACQSADKQTDRLLYEQRLACLDSALIHLNGATASVASGDIARFVQSWGGAFALPALHDCTNTRALRAQPPTPPENIRDEVKQLVMDVHRARVTVREAVTGFEVRDLETTLQRMDQVVARLDMLGVSAANAAATAQSMYLVQLAGRYKQYVPRARDTIQAAIARAERMRDDRFAVEDYKLLAQLDSFHGNPTKADEALDRAERAAERAAVSALGPEVIEREARAGRFDRAIELQNSLSPGDQPGLVLEHMRDRARMLARAGRGKAALQAHRDSVRRHAEFFGEHHVWTANVRRDLAVFLDSTGDFEGALAEVDRIGVIHERIRASKTRRLEIRQLQIGFAINANRPDLIEQGIAAGVRPTDLQSFSYAVARCDVGAAFVALDRLEKSPVAGMNASAIDERRAMLAFGVGDLTAMRRHADRALQGVQQGTANPVAPWYLAISDARAGRIREADVRRARLAPLLERAPLDWAGRAFDGIVLATLGRWRDARERFAQARDKAGSKRDTNRAEIDAWLGLALLESGDAQPALEPLEESLAITAKHCVDYYTPIAEFALARALRETGGDKARARTLAEQARDHFAKLGPFREPDRQRVIRWLAAQRW